MNRIPTQDIFPGIRFNSNTWDTLPNPFEIRTEFLTHARQYNCHVLRDQSGNRIGNRFFSADEQCEFTFKVCLDRNEEFFIHDNHIILNEGPEPTFSALLKAGSAIPLSDNRKWFNAYNAYLNGSEFNKYYPSEIHSAVFVYANTDEIRRVTMTIEKIAIDWSGEIPRVQVDPDGIVISQRITQSGSLGSIQQGVHISELTHMFPGGIVIDNGRFRFVDDVDRVVFETDHLEDQG